MKRNKDKLLLATFVFFLCGSGISAAAAPVSKRDSERPPFVQLSGGAVYSYIDLSRYLVSTPYRGLHVRTVCYAGGSFFISAEYSVFPKHSSPAAWDNVQTKKYDLNGHFSFFTHHRRLRVFALAGVNLHHWKGTRTGYTDMDQFGRGIPEGAVIRVKRWGINSGCGFTQTVHDNIGITGDFRFNFAPSKSYEKVRIMDVLTTVGVNFIIPYPAPNETRRRKTFSVGKKIYKWTEKGGK